MILNSEQILWTHLWQNNFKQEEIERTLARVKKELTEKQITLTNLFNFWLKEKDPNWKPLDQIRPSSAIKTYKILKDSELFTNKIDTSLLRGVLENVGIFVPFEEFETMLSAFKLSKRKYITYPEFLKVFAQTHYPQPFVRTTHLEKADSFSPK